MNVAVLNTTGSRNVIMGSQAGDAQTIASNNVIIGFQAGTNSTAGNCTFLGFQAGLNNTTGTNNVFMGTGAGQNNTVGNTNICIGLGAGPNLIGGNNNTIIGAYAGNAMTVGNANCYFGTKSGSASVNANANICIGYNAQASTGITGATAIGTDVSAILSNGFYIRKQLATVTGGAALNYLATTGQLGLAASSKRFKKEVEYRDRKVTETQYINQLTKWQRGQIKAFWVESVLLLMGSFLLIFKIIR